MNELRVSYILHNYIYTPLVYSKRDNSWIGIYLNMMNLLTPEILKIRLESDLGISAPESFIEAILAYPKHNNIEKDVTVVFRY